MKDIAEQRGLPSFLVEMRHQAVHESQRITPNLMHKALIHLQGFLFASYWHPLYSKLSKRQQQVQTVFEQISSFQTGSTPPNLDKLLEISIHKNESEKQCRQNLRTIMNKFTRNNIKLSIPLDMNQVVDLIKVLVDCSLQRISVKFLKLKDLQYQCNHFQLFFDQYNS
jgi:hypothetical protein